MFQTQPARRNKVIIVIFTVGLFFFAFQNCEQTDFEQGPASNQNKVVTASFTGTRFSSLKSSPGPEQRGPSSNSVVCNPFGIPKVSSTATVANGAVAKLYERHDKVRRARHSLDESLILPVSIFFTQLNYPTQAFSEGFKTESGQVVQAKNGDPLTKSFSLAIRGQIQVQQSDQAGLYQFGLISEGGSVLKIRRPGGQLLVTWIDNDWDQKSPKMICASDTVEFRVGDPMPFEITYHHSSLGKMALSLIWRKVPEGKNTLGDPLCGKSGQTLFWNGDSNSNLSAGLHQLSQRGWRLLGPEQLLLPEEFLENPCTR